MIQERLIWVRNYIPALMQQVVAGPIVELKTEPRSDYVHGSFFWELGEAVILVQAVNTVKLATKGELVEAPGVEVRINPSKLKVERARVIPGGEQRCRSGPRTGALTSRREGLIATWFYASVWLSLICGCGHVA